MNLLQWNEKELTWKWAKGLLLLESVLCIALLVSVCFNNNIWWDEAYTYDMVMHHSVREICVLTAMDVHPPLYYLLCKAAVFLFGGSLFTFKMTSVAANVAAACLGMTKIYRRFGLKTAAIFIFLSCFAPHMAFFAVQLRMYSWASFFILASAVYAYEVYCGNRKSDWILFVLFSLGGAYTLYFACVSISWIYLALLSAVLWKKRSLLKRFAAACIATAIGYLPWLYMFVSYTLKGTASFPDAEEELSSAEFFGTFWKWAFSAGIRLDGLIYAGLLFLALMAVWFFGEKCCRGQRRVFVITLLMTSVYTIFFGILLSRLMKWTLMERYIEPTLLLVWLAFSIGIANYKNRVFYLTMACVILLGTENYRYVYHDEYHVAPLLDETEQFIAGEMKPGDVVVYELEPYRIMYEYYMPEQELIYYEDMDLEQFTGKSFWYLDAWGGYFDADSVEKYQIKKEDCGSYGIQSMNFKIYRVTVDGNGS